MSELKINLMRLPHSEGLPLPAYETAGAAGMDLRAAVAESSPVTLGPGERAAIPTGLALGLPASATRPPWTVCWKIFWSPLLKPKPPALTARCARPTKNATKMRWTNSSPHTRWL